MNVFGSSRHDNRNKTDTSLFVQKPYLRDKYGEANIEEDIDSKNQYRSKNLPGPINIREAVSKNHFDNKFNDPSKIANTAHIDLNDKNITDVRFIQIIQWPQTDSHLTAKLYVVVSIDEASLVRINKDNDFNYFNVTNMNIITLNTQAVTDNQVITKAYVDQFRQEFERSRQDLRIDFYNESSDLLKNYQVNDFNGKKIINIDSITTNREPTSGNEVTNENYVDDSIGEGTKRRFNQTLQNYLKVSVENDIYSLTNFDEIQFIDKTKTEYPNTGGDLPQNWLKNCDEKNNSGKLQNFLK